MARNSWICHLSLLFWWCAIYFARFSSVSLHFHAWVVSEYCGNDVHCQAPYKCCANSLACCYDHDKNDYIRGFKLHVWNMWYFWLVVLFILMSCFGGCGYYRRRRLAAMQQSASTPTSPRRTCVSRQRHSAPQSAYAYTGPGADTGSTMALPPPYTEVMQQPNLYPANKVELPPYPGPPADKDPNQVDQSEEVSPPAYCEVVMPLSQFSEGTAGRMRTEHVTVPVESGNQDEHSSNVGGSAQAAGSS